MYASLHLHKQHYQKWSLDRSLSRRNQVDLRTICWHNLGILGKVGALTEPRPHKYTIDCELIFCKIILEFSLLIADVFVFSS